MTEEKINLKTPRTGILSKFVDWLALPRSLREPKTARAFAQENGVSERTLLRWKRRPKVREAVEKLVLAYGHDRYPDVIEGIADAAANGDAAAGRLYLQHVKGWNEKSPHQDKPQPEEMEVFIGGKRAERLPIGLVKRSGTETNPPSPVGLLN